jgi:uncharacterized protein YabN with tetrapyrrole methylase and pyrophosphatase domain
MSAQKMSKKAVGVGFEWENENDIWDCFYSEIKEFKEAKNQQEREDEFGDILFSLVNIARWNKIDAEQALLNANKKFSTRFRKMEELAKNLSNQPAASIENHNENSNENHNEESSLTLQDLSYDQWDSLWKQAKKLV